MKCTNDISDDGHVAFLLFWLHHSFLCDRSCRKNDRYVTLASLLHEGKDVCLSKILLSSLYEYLGLTYKSFKNSNWIPPNMAGPLWLLQLWLNVIYSPYFTAPSSTLGCRTPCDVCLVPIIRSICRGYYVTVF